MPGASRISQIDLAFNKAGIGGPNGLLADAGIEGDRKLMDLNLHSALYSMYHQIPQNA